MIAYIARRVFSAIPVLLGVSALVFLTLRLTPGDPAVILAGENAQAEVVAEIRRDLGLDQPVPVQFAIWLSSVVRGDLGRSLRSNEPVVDVIGRTAGATFELALLGVVLAAVVGIPAGVVSAMKRGRAADVATRLGAFAGLSLPVFVVGLGLIFIFALTLRWLPVSGRGGPVWTVEGIRHAILPVVTLSVFSIAILTRLTRSSMLEVLSNDYIRTATAKGLTDRAVVFRHGLRNALLPVVTVIGLQFGGLLGGAIVVESIFAWPGLGRTLLGAISARDFPVIQGIVLFMAVVFVTVNLVVDLAYAWLDPRIRFTE